MDYDSAFYQDPSGLCAGVDSLEDEAASLVPSVTRPGVTSMDTVTSMVDNMTNMTSLDNMTSMVDNMTNMASLVGTGPAQVVGTGVYSGAEDQGKSLNQATASHGGSNEDMKKVLMELDNTGYFAEVITQTITYTCPCPILTRPCYSISSGQFTFIFHIRRSYL